MLAAAAPVLFVLIWSTGFVVARLTVPHAAPELIVLARLALTAVLLATLAASARERWPRGRRLVLHIVAGMLLNGLYLCLSWWAVSRGMPAGIMSLLGATQPLMIAVASSALFGERLPGRGWLGLAIGLGGVVLVLAPLIARGGTDAVSAAAALAALIAIASMAAGTMIQRGALAADPIRVSGAVQNAGGTPVALVAVLAVGDHRWDGSLVLWAGLAWSVIALSAIGLGLLVWMVRHQGATRVSALLLLVPALAAVEARALFGERLVAMQLLGFALALGGVLLARVRARATVAEPG